MDIEDEIEVSQQFNVMSVPTLVFIPLEGAPAISPGAASKNQLKEIIDDKLLGNGSKVEASDKGLCKTDCGCKSKIEETKEENPINTFNKIITKIRSVLS